MPHVNENMDDDNDSSTLHIGNGARMQSEIKSAEGSPDNLITHQETRSVLLIKLTSVAVLLLAMVVVSIVVFFNGKRDNEATFRNQFESYASTTLDAFQENLGRAITSVDLMSVSMTSYAIAAGLRWPNVTFPYFEASAVLGSSLAASSTIGFTPLVTNSTRTGWEVYAVKNQHWIQDAIEWKNDHPEFYSGGAAASPYKDLSSIHPQIYTVDSNEKPVTEEQSQYYAPLWQVHPIPLDPNVINFDQLSHNSYKTPLNTLINTKASVISDFLVLDQDPLGPSNASEFPLSTLFYPVYTDFNRASLGLGGFLAMKFSWKEYIQLSVPAGSSGGTIVLSNSCGQYRTFEIDGNEVVYVGEGDMHDVKFDSMAQQRDLWNFFNSLPGSAPTSEVGCHFTIEIYPSKSTKAMSSSKKPAVYVAVVVSIFAFALVVLLAYDYAVTRPIRALKQEVARSNAIVSSFFPPNVRDRLLRGDEPGQVASRVAPTNTTPVVPSIPTKSTSEPKPEYGTVSNILARVGESPKIQLTKFLHTKGEYNGGSIDESKPIADLFPNTTIFFADIANFTAWSSTREPSQVFNLLENLFGEMDAVARRKGVFKVETVGDCYMAVTGLPDPQDDHAVIMASFARACLKIMTDVITRLEATLGPETAELSLRIGLHSGPVTAGVLRGEKSRFQLFGDTVNTASRMESTGMCNRIHLSQDTADWLIAAGKASWIRTREDLVNAKGKGKMQTYWLVSRDDRTTSSSISAYHDSACSPPTSEKLQELGMTQEPKLPIPSIVTNDLAFQPKSHRRDSIASCLSSTTNSSIGDSHSKLVDWIVELLHGLLKSLVARRSIGWRLKLLKGSLPDVELTDSNVNLEAVMNEIRTPITFPTRGEDDDIHFLEDIVKADSMELPTAIVHQLRDYVTTIANFYHGENHFHNFEHASHVVMTADRLVKRILDINPSNYHSLADDNALFGWDNAGVQKPAVNSFSKVDPHSAGDDGDHHGDDIVSLLSDPLVHFAILFSALIHDVHHPGAESNVPAATPKLARRGSKLDEITISHHNSFRVAWDLLLIDRYGELRKCIAATSSDALCFRKTVLHCVIGANSTEKSLISQRRRNWAVAFHQPVQHQPQTPHHELKVTCLIELIMQAADMAHAMQTWHIYQKWNEKLFLESYYREIDMAVNDFAENLASPFVELSMKCRHPTLSPESWYESELEFFDKKVIPVANKLKECGLLGAASDVYLNNAIENRQEWASQGKRVIGAVMSLVQSIRALDASTTNSQHP